MYRLVIRIEPHLVLSLNALGFPRWMDRNPRKVVITTIAAGVNDPSAGSPTEALLRLVLPLSDKVCETSRSEAIAGSPQSELLTGSLNR